MQGHSEMLGGKTHNVQCRVEALSPMNILDFKSPFLLVGLVLKVTCAINTSFICVSWLKSSIPALVLRE